MIIQNNMGDINLTVREKNFGYRPEHILSDYLVSRNIQSMD